LRLTVLDGDKAIASEILTANPFRLRLTRPDLKLWSPASPQLYDVKLELVDGEKVVDSVASYFALRKISLGQDAAGITRIMLNNQFVFQYGPLDQGFWPDGLYTAPSDEALRYDLEVTKRLGFNMVRKHVKVESARWYYHCDKLGLLVWQDMPSGDKHIGARDPDIQRSTESAQQFESEWSEIIRDFGHFPSIVMWVPFNEGWGQFDTSSNSRARLIPPGW
jgi:beta-galactosidase/beta-glucuronidase